MVNAPVGLEEFFALMNIRVERWQMILLKAREASTTHRPSNLPAPMNTASPRPKTSLPDVIYQRLFTTGVWQYKFDQPGSFWMNSNTMCTGDDECLTRTRRNFPERHIRFTHDPRDGRRLSPLSTMIFTAWDLDKPAATSPVTVKVSDSVTYRYNDERKLWEFTWPTAKGGWHTSDSLNSDTKSDPYILTDEQLAKLKADWPGTEVLVEPLRSSTTYYRFAKRWEYYSKRYNAWRESNVYSHLSIDEGLKRVQRDADNDRRLSPNYKVVITTIDGVRLDEWKQNSEAQRLLRATLDRTYERVHGAIFGEQSQAPIPGRAFYPGAPIPVSSPLAYPDFALGRIEPDSVLLKTERHRFNRVHTGLPSIPLDREWLNGSGDLIDLKTVDNEHLRNIVNMVMRGARVSGQKIERTPERVRQGLNAAAEQAERIERFEHAKVKAEIGEKAVRNEALSFLNSFRSLKRLVDPSVTLDKAAK